jgi:hypothetical protein
MAVEPESGFDAVNEQKSGEGRYRHDTGQGGGEASRLRALKRRHARALACVERKGEPDNGDVRSWRGVDDLCDKRSRSRSPHRTPSFRAEFHFIRIPESAGFGAICFTAFLAKRENHTWV